MACDEFRARDTEGGIYSRWWLWLIGIGAAVELFFWMVGRRTDIVINIPFVMNPWWFFGAMGLTMFGLGLSAITERECPFDYMILGFFTIAGPLGYLAWIAVERWHQTDPNPTRFKAVIRLFVRLCIACGILFSVGVFNYLEIGERLWQH